jgi:hypothetical protein
MYRLIILPFLLTILVGCPSSIDKTDISGAFAYCQKSIQQELNNPDFTTWGTDRLNEGKSVIPDRYRPSSVVNVTLLEKCLDGRNNVTSYKISVNGWVASQKDSEIMIKNNYRCTVSKRISSNSWKLLELQLCGKNPCGESDKKVIKVEEDKPHSE